MAHRLSDSSARGISLDQESNLCLLHWQADSLPLNHQGSPREVLDALPCRATVKGILVWPKFVPVFLWKNLNELFGQVCIIAPHCSWVPICKFIYLLNLFVIPKSKLSATVSFVDMNRMVKILSALTHVSQLRSNKVMFLL